ncbi:hypothetical protein CLU79DRAFT_766801 [Phycomyces nitens]|nr:hypothetical protein CLU79DRAFT_766801 [Phycomyces nitens]
MELALENQNKKCPLCDSLLNSFTVDFRQSTVFMCVNYKCSYPFEQHTLGVYFKPSKIIRKKGSKKRKTKKTKRVRGVCSSSNNSLETSVRFPDMSLVESPQLQTPATTRSTSSLEKDILSFSPTQIAKETEDALGDISAPSLVSTDWSLDEINKLFADEIPIVFPPNDQTIIQEPNQQSLY